VAPGFGLDAMIASRLGLEDLGTGGGAAASGRGAGWLEGTEGGSTVALLLNPIESADRCGGGTMGLVGWVVVAVRLGSGGTDLSEERSDAFMGCLGGSDGLEGSAGECQ
jgi:hypothetical protein